MDGEQIVAEHRVDLRLDGRSWWGHCKTCCWTGQLRATKVEACVDATAHAAAMAREGEDDE